MSTISEIATRMERVNEARSLRLRELQRAAAERLKISAREGEVGNDANELEADLNEGNVGHDGVEFPDRPSLTLGPTWGMDVKEAKVIARFTKDCHRVTESIKNLKSDIPGTAQWWNRMQAQIAEGRFLETREDIYNLVQRYPGPQGTEVQYVEALQRVYLRL